MVKIYFTLILGIFLIGDLGAQAPVMNPITGASVVCSPPTAAEIYTASASNSPTSYSWSVVPSASVIIGTPTNSTTTISYPTPDGTYTVYCDASNSFGTSPTTSFVVTVFETPNITFSGSTYFCQGSSTNISASSTMLSASPTISYFWSPPTGLSTTVGQFVSASPTTITNYTVTAFNGSCSNTGTITITPMASPTINVVVSSSVICAGDPVSIFPSGASTYFITSTWISGLPIGFPFNPPVSATYSVYGTSAFGCSGLGITNIAVNPAPVINVGAFPALACMGQSVALTFSGTSASYSINGVACGNSVAISPTVNTTYTISGVTSQGCTGSFAYTQIVGCVGISNPVFAEPVGLTAFPNPNSGQFILNSGSDETVRIVNELGQLIRTVDLKSNTETKIDALSPGVYFVLSQRTRIKIVVLQ